MNDQNGVEPWVRPKVRDSDEMHETHGAGKPPEKSGCFITEHGR